MANKIDICNRALDKLGVETISSFNDESKEARICKRNYNTLRKKLLRSHWWNFAIKREILLTETSSTENNVAEVGSTTTNLTLTAHGLAVGNEIIFNSTVGNFNGKQAFVKTVVDANNVTLDRAMPSTITAGDVFSIYINRPKFDFSNQFSLPSDNLRILKLEGQLRLFKFKIEGEKIVANTTELGVVYVNDESDVDVMDPTFQEALVFLLAEEFAYPLIQSTALAQTMYQKYLLELRDIRSIDAQVGTPQELFAEDWLESRLTGSTLRRGDGTL